MISGGLRIEPGWALFLDRDGVLNRRIVDGYVTGWSEFEWLPGVPEALRILAGLFDPVIVVSNQQGVGKGLMTDEAVAAIHGRLIEEAGKAGGRIDAIYYSPHLEHDGSVMRKPGVGMGLKARREFPRIRFRQSVMAGDSLSDMLFGRRLGMTTIFLTDDLKMVRRNYRLIDFAYPDLPALADDLAASEIIQFTSPP